MRRRRWARGPVLAAALAALAVLGAPAAAQPRPDPDEPALFKADDITYDSRTGVVTARGHVQIAQDQYVLLADRVVYDRRRDVVSASGHVSLLDPSGDVLFVDTIELSGDFKNGVAEDIRLRLADESRMAAAGGRRVGGTVTELRRAVYSPCPLCKEDPTRAPLWQVKAERVVRDEAAQEIRYYDAWLEFFGVPVVYTPYLAQPDPTVKRKSGFLPPRLGSDSELGQIVGIPYYWVIGPDKDATVTAIATTREGPVLVPEYRQRFAHAALDMTGSLTEGSITRNGRTHDAVRGHFDGTLRADIDETWRGGLDVRFASDRTYLRRYHFGDDRTLTSRGFLEGFRGSAYASANAYYFQSQRAESDSSDRPLILPQLDYSFVSEPDLLGGRWRADADLLSLTRAEGTDSRRLSLQTEWRRPLTTRAGEVYTVFASLRTDGYLVDDVIDPDDGSSFSGVTGRIFPQAGAEWRFPLIGTLAGADTIIEPVAMAVVAPEAPNSDRIPNEDSRDFELDDTNILSDDRFPGRDRIEGGTRLQYGVKVRMFDLWRGGQAAGFVGQSYRLSDTEASFGNTGLRKGFSDIVGRFELRFRDVAELLYRFRLDDRDLSPRRTEVSATLGPPALRLKVGYFALESVDPTQFDRREEIALGLSSQFAEHWSARVQTRRNIERGEAISHAAEIAYADSCFVARLGFTRRLTEDADVEPTDTVLLQISLRTLGDVRAQAPAGGFLY